jgi:sugar phosphate isomerase/epimerase
MPGVSLEKAIDLVRRAEFRVMEIISGSFGSVVGVPALESPGVRLSEYSVEARARLRRQVADFDEVIVHAHSLDLNIASDNAGVRGESVRQYLDVLDFGAELGAKRVTFHPGSPSRPNSAPDAVVSRCIEFAHRARDRAASHGLQAGFENVGGHGMGTGGLTLSQFREILDAVGPPFGLHFDLGWSVRRTHPAPGQDLMATIVRPWFQVFHQRIVAVHLHGVMATAPFGILHHMPVHMDNLLDYREVMALLRASAPGCPLVFEPLMRSAEEAVAASLRDVQLLEAIETEVIHGP